MVLGRKTQCLCASSPDLPLRTKALTSWASRSVVLRSCPWPHPRVALSLRTAVLASEWLISGIRAKPCLPHSSVSLKGYPSFRACRGMAELSAAVQLSLCSLFYLLIWEESITLSKMLIQRTEQFSRSVVSDSPRPHEPQHARPPCPSPTPRFHPNSCPSSWWYHPATSSSVVPFSSCPQSLPASGSFPMSQLFAWSGQSIGVSTST